MTEQATILLVSHPFVEEQFREVAARLAASGLQVLSYDDATVCCADAHKLQNVDAILCMHDFPLTREFMMSLPKLRAAFSFVTGTEGFDEPAATELGILIGNGQICENFDSMAEATIMLMLVALYDLHGAEQLQRKNLPRPRTFTASMLMGKTVGLIGFGQIARAIVERLRTWSVKLQVYAPRFRTPIPPEVRQVELDELLRTSDVVSVLASLNAQSRYLLNAERLATIKPGAVLVNTARGGLIDEAALCRLAREGRFKALALDTFEVEPLPLDSPLRALPNAILTPHRVGHTIETHRGLVEAAVANLKRVIRAELPAQIRNPDVIAHWNRRWAAGKTAARG